MQPEIICMLMVDSDPASKSDHHCLEQIFSEINVDGIAQNKRAVIQQAKHAHVD